RRAHDAADEQQPPQARGSRGIRAVSQRVDPDRDSRVGVDAAVPEDEERKARSQAFVGVRGARPGGYMPPCSTARRCDPTHTSVVRVAPSLFVIVNPKFPLPVCSPPSPVVTHAASGVTAQTQPAPVVTARPTSVPVASAPTDWLDRT